MPTPDSQRAVRSQAQAGRARSGAAAPVGASLESPSPPGGRPRMSLEQRAKIFIPFDPLEGFSATLRATELEYEIAQAHKDRGDEYLRPGETPGESPRAQRR